MRCCHDISHLIPGPGHVYSCIQLRSVHWGLSQRTCDQCNATTVRLHRARRQSLSCVALTEEGRWCGKAKNPAPPTFRCEHASQAPDLYAVILASACAAAAFDSMSALAHTPTLSVSPKLDLDGSGLGISWDGCARPSR